MKQLTARPETVAHEAPNPTQARRPKSAAEPGPYPADAAAAA
ncbi:hypothetical protein [Kitasatospora sp. NPDC001683]